MLTPIITITARPAYGVNSIGALNSLIANVLIPEYQDIEVDAVEKLEGNQINWHGKSMIILRFHPRYLKNKKLAADLMREVRIYSIESIILREIPGVAILGAVCEWSNSNAD